MKIRKLKIVFVLIVACSFTNCNNQIGDDSINAKGEFTISEIVVSSKGSSNYLAGQNDLILKDDQEIPDSSIIILDPSIQYQSIEGFGGSLNDAAAETFYQLSPLNRQIFLEAYFSKEKGLGLNLFRTHINSSNFSSESYAYAEVDGDIGLEHFNVNHDLKYRIPFIKAVKNTVSIDFKLVAAPWSPPAWMKTNNHMLQGGKLKPEFNKIWANYFVKFVQQYNRNDIPLWGLMVQNQPDKKEKWESCLFSEYEEQAFSENYLAPALNENDLNEIQIVSSNSFGASEIMISECESKSDDWEWAEKYGELIINNLNEGARGWINQNLLLNEHGGPNHFGNHCHAPVIGNVQEDVLEFSPSFYALGHFSKFIHPDSKRILCKSKNNSLMATAAINDDGSIAVVILNTSEIAIDYKLWVKDNQHGLNIPPHSIKTIVLK